MNCRKGFLFRLSADIGQFWSFWNVKRDDHGLCHVIDASHSDAIGDQWPVRAQNLWVNHVTSFFCWPTSSCVPMWFRLARIPLTILPCSSRTVTLLTMFRSSLIKTPRQCFCNGKNDMLLLSYCKQERLCYNQVSIVNENRSLERSKVSLIADSKKDATLTAFFCILWDGTRIAGSYMEEKEDLNSHVTQRIH